MARYLPVLRLCVRHDYFAGGHWRGLRWQADPATAALIRSHGLLLAPGGHEIALHCREDLLEGLALRALDDGTLAVVLRAFADDGRAFNVTALPEREGAVLGFENRGKVAVGEALTLQAADRVGAADLQELSAPGLSALITRRDTLTPPAFIARLTLDGPAITSVGEHDGFVFEIAFAARETFWKYYVLGSLGEADVFVTDPTGEVDFEFLGREGLAPDRSAAVFRSTSPIPMRERSGRRVQLRRRGANGERVLVQRLPVPTAQLVVPDTTDGQQAMLSEIFVNC